MKRQSIDFAALKARVSLEDVARILALQLKKDGTAFRCACPQHGDDPRRLVVTPDKGFYCFGDKKGGDQIQLYAHVKAITNYAAAEQLLQHLGEPATSPAKAEPDGSRGSSQPTHSLMTSHPVAELLGLSVATIEALGAGYDDKTQRLVIPLRTSTGAQIGQLGIATSAAQNPLLAFRVDEEVLTAATKPPPDELRKLFRVVG